MSRRSRRGGERSPAASRRAAACALVLVAGVTALEVKGQGLPDREAYLQVVSRHFDLPAGEAERLVEGRIAVDELPLVLFLERESGIAAPALLALRRGGAPWAAVARRGGVGGDRFHVEIPEGTVDARTRRIFDLFQRTPRAGWSALEFSDEELVTLVNLKMLSRRFSVSVERVIRVRGEVESWVAVPAVLARGGRG